MGRCNNRRAQQKAQELRNTPSRARFSSHPPNKKQGRGGGGRGRGNKNADNNATGRGRGRGEGAAKAAVVEKITKRVEQKSATTSTSTQKRRQQHPLTNVNISKLEELVVPEESLQEVMQLLSDLNVKVVESANNNAAATNYYKQDNDNDDDDNSTRADSEYDDGNDNEHEPEEQDVDGKTRRRPKQPKAAAGYTEYEEEQYSDQEEAALGMDAYGMTDPTADWEGTEEEHDDDDDDEEEDDEQQQQSIAANRKAQAKLRLDPVFTHLTQRLSFSQETAARACQAIEDMVAGGDNSSDNHKDNDNNSSNTTDKPLQQQQQQQNRESERMALAMDWLCLHVEEDALQAGFKPNKNMSSPILLMGTGRTKPIPHPSISVAPRITTDRQWRKSILVQEQIVGFLQLGFQHTEAYEVFQQYTLEQLQQQASSSTPQKAAIHNDKALRVLLKTLEQKTLLRMQDDDNNNNGNNNSHSNQASQEQQQQQPSQVDLDWAAEERESEEQALKAIYDDQFQIIQNDNEDDKHQYRYTVGVDLSEPLREPARSEECVLHVFVRPGYPALETPLLLFHNPSLPPSLLRRVNVELIRHAHENNRGGAPVVFEAVNYLSSYLPSLQLEFVKEQRTKEMEAEQVRMRREAGHVVVDGTEEYYNDESESDTKGLGRRQRAKIKAAAKAYDQPEKAKQAEAERQQRQAVRLERIKGEEKNIRQSMAERAMEKRNKERQDEEINAVYRSALSASLNKGDSAEKARAIAQKAKAAYLKLHGIHDPHAPPTSANDAAVDHQTENRAEKKSVNGDDDDELDDDDDTAEAAPFSTPTTAAFMERLREMYAAAAKEKAEGKSTGGRPSKAGNKKQQQEEDLDGYHLNPPKTSLLDSSQDVDSEKQRFPRPVAVPVGELKRVMEDVISTQKEQPWLVSPEARAPETSTSDDPDNDRKVSQKCQDISRKLKDENERKSKAVEQWRRKNNNASENNKENGKNQKGFTPHRFDKMLSQRERLPAFAMRDHIISTIDSNQVTVVAGDTGCGKTTQVPQLVLDEFISRNRGAEANIIVTQPRRISAIGVSERIADERCERVGETCGYSIMLERKASRKTRLLLCTTGILLRRLQVDPDVASISHIFVDEVHERDLNTDFLLIILRDLLKRRKSLKLVLMSATLNAEAFSDYFGGCAIVSIPGRAHPVQEYRLEDVLQLTEYEVDEDSDYALKSNDHKRFSKSALRKMYYPRYTTKVIHSLSVVNEKVINYELLAALLEKICETQDEGAILVFMPGMMEITKAVEEMHKKEFFQSPAVVIYPLHSSLTTAEQTAVFDVPPEGVRKIVIGTNIAETSITIEDVVYVVDCGRVKENRKDEINETPTLVETWVSRASAKQRRGRAGRVRPGVAYHMFSSHTYEHDMEEYQQPEMLRVGLEDLTLQILILDLGEPSKFLGQALNPPSELSMRNSLKLLEELGAVECDWRTNNDGGIVKLEEPKPPEVEDENDPLAKRCGDMEVASELTALGFHLATLPVDPRVGKMMIYGALFGCIDPALTIASSMSARSPFVSPFDKRDEADAARQKFSNDISDHLATLNAFTRWRDIRSKKGDRAAQNFLRDNFLSRQTLFQMGDLRKQFANLLVSIGFLPDSFQLEKTRGGKGNNSNGSNNNNSSGGEDMANANVNGNNMALVKAVLCAGLYPNIIVAPRTLVGPVGGGDNKEAGEVAFQSLNKGDVYLHPSTVAFHEKRLDSRYCCYHEMVKTSKTYVRDCTTVSPFALVLFGGTLVVYQEKGVVTVDEWLKFRIGRRPATLVKHLRAQMESMLLRKIVSPEDDVTASPVGKALIQSISTLLQRDKAGREERNDGAEIVRPWRGGEDQNGDNNSNNNSSGNHRGGGGRGSSRGGRGRGRGGRGGRGRGRGGR